MKKTTLVTRIHNLLEADADRKKLIGSTMIKNQSGFSPLTLNIATGFAGDYGIDSRIDILSGMPLMELIEFELSSIK
jgi:hypothetical protein